MYSFLGRKSFNIIKRRLGTTGAFIPHGINFPQATHAISTPKGNDKREIPLILENPASESDQLAEKELIQVGKEIIGSFNAPIRFAAMYGSGAIAQKKSDSGSHSPTSALLEEPMLDFLIGVTHPEHWHWINLQQNWDHYSAVKYLGGAPVVSSIQSNFGAGIYYNAMVQVNVSGGRTRLVKYGVVAMDTLCSDLTHWNTFFLSGRLQKPIRVLRDDPRVRAANAVNLSHALRLALLTLPMQFSERQLFQRLASLSYLGDPRMSLRAEHPRKVENIVANQHFHFRNLYSQSIDHLPQVAYCRGAYLSQDMSPSARLDLIMRLPEPFKKHILALHQSKGEALNNQIEEELRLWKEILSLPMDQLENLLNKAVIRTSRSAAFAQSLQGFITAGPVKSTQYFLRKLHKGLQ